jgi:hypothetical protein
MLVASLIAVAMAGRAKDGARRVESFSMGESTFRVEFGEGAMDLPDSGVMGRIERAARAIAVYYGRIPVSRIRIVVEPVAGAHGALQGTTWGYRGGYPAMLRLGVGEHVTREEPDKDWVITHELVHTALPSLPDDEHWLEEGLASYVEPIARVQAGEMAPEGIWADMVRGMENGEPGMGDRGLNHTHTWGRTYWGGALFCLVADVEIRRETGSRLGLQDALRAVVDAGGGIDKEWPVERVLRTGDEATGTHVLEEMYGRWSEQAVTVDLPEMWRRLGVRQVMGGVVLDPTAPDAGLRVAITRPHAEGGGIH